MHTYKNKFYAFVYILFGYYFHFKMQELHEKQEQFLCVNEIIETQEKMSELEQLKEQLKAKDSSLESIENERLKLTEILQKSEEEMKIIIKEGDEVKRVQESLQMERDHLKENIEELVAEVSFPLLLFFGYKSSIKVITMLTINFYY